MSLQIWIYLLAALVLEVTGTILLKFSDGFTKPLPTVSFIVCFGTMFFILSKIVRHVELGMTYAIWAGLGTMLVATAGVIIFKESLTWIKVISIGLIILGVVGLNWQGGAR